MNNFFVFAGNYLGQVQEMVKALDQTGSLGKIQEAVGLIKACKGTVWLCGNGGSAALASHMATDLQLAGVRAVALTDVAAITTIGNDSRYVDIFHTQLERLARAEDLIIAISGSGNSTNVGHALVYGREHKIPTIFISGFNGGKFGELYTTKWQEGLRFQGVHINVPSTHMGVAQDGHQIVLHMICYYLMEEGRA